MFPVVSSYLENYTYCMTLLQSNCLNGTSMLTNGKG